MQNTTELSQDTHGTRGVSGSVFTPSSKDLIARQHVCVCRDHKAPPARSAQSTILFVSLQ